MIKQEVFGMPYDEQVSKKFGVTAYKDNEGWYYILELGTFYALKEMCGNDFKKEMEIYRQNLNR